MIKKNLFTLLLLSLTLASQAQFVHPGMLHSREDLDYVKMQIASGQEPWKTAWQQLQNADIAQLEWRPQAISHVADGSYARPSNGGFELSADGDAAYTMALQWYMTGDRAYARKAIEIINAWSYRLDSVTHSNARLVVGVAGVKFLNAAEIIKHTYKGWSAKDQEAFRRMVLGIWYPLIKDWTPRHNGNWDAALAQTMMCMGIFYDRADIFERAYNHILSGDTNGAIDNYLMENGQCQESGRDQGHTQMGLGLLAVCCEIARNQSRDLYGAYDNRLLRGFEYTARYNLGEDVPYVRYVAWYGTPVFGPEISAQGRGSLKPVYEPVYRHYVERKGLEMPYTKQVLDKTRIQRRGDWTGMCWGTLMFAGCPGK